MQVTGKVGNSNPAISQTPGPMVIKIAVGDHGDDFGIHTLCKISLRFDHAFPPRPRVRMGVQNDSVSLFLAGRGSSVTIQPSPLHRFFFTINKSDDVVSRKDVPFGGPKTNFYILTPFPPKQQFWGNL